MKKLIAFAVVFFVSYSASAQTTISYQGMIQGVKGAPVRDSVYSIEVSFWTAATGGTRVWQDVFQTPVRGGVFNIQLGSGNPLPSPKDMDQPLWIGVSFGGEEMPTRSSLSAVPMALNVADSSITAKKLNLDYISSININGVQFTGHGTPLTVQGENGIEVAYNSDSNALVLRGTNSNQNPLVANGNGSTNWGEKGNTGTTPGTNYAGTSDSVAFEIHVNDSGDHSNGNGRVMRYEPEQMSPNIIGGFNGNYELSSLGAVIAGGGEHLAPNYVSAGAFGTIGGGKNNQVDNAVGTIAGGEGAKVLSEWGTVGGGLNNTAGTLFDNNSQHQTVAGGNQNTASGDDAAIAGGEYNSATAYHTTVAGGISNQATATGAAVGGGDTNVASGANAAIMGGADNTASGTVASILGGQHLQLGNYSVGFNASGTPTNLSSIANIAYFGNVNLWLGNVDSSSRELRFYEPNTNATYTGTNFTAFKAGSQDSNMIYTLPLAPPDTNGQVLGVVRGAPSGTVQLGWIAAGSGGGNFWALNGNSGTNPGSPKFNYLGTQDSEAFEIHIHNNTTDTTGGNQRVMRYSEGPTSPNILGGSSFDSLTPGLSGAAILSGGTKLAPNIVSDSFSVVAGGRGNLIQGPLSVISGGDSNQITSVGADHNFIGGGYQNVEANPSFGVVVGGYRNYLAYDAYSSVIGGGEFDTVYTSRSFLGGGHGNVIHGGGAYADFATLGGGEANSLQGSHAVLVGGQQNWILGDYSAIVAGVSDSIGWSHWDFMGGGLGNSILNGSEYAVLGGGSRNRITDSGVYSVLAGGDSNYAAGPHVTISGGSADSAFFEADAISGGMHNIIRDSFSFIGGGYGNKIMPDTVSESVIVGGYSNLIDTNAGVSTIAGGQANYIGAVGSAIGGGLSDTIRRIGMFSTIAGGAYNLDSGQITTIGGGVDNGVFAFGSTIAGGDGNIIWDTGSTIAGGYRNIIGKAVEMR